MLLDDKQQFKRDYNDLKFLHKESEEYASKKSSLKKVKQLLDSKITNINSCIKSINKSEGMLKEFERGLSTRLKSLHMDEFNLVDDQNENNGHIQFGHNMERYYSFDENNDYFNLEGIDEDIKDR